jgi:hypothetical protein
MYSFVCHADPHSTVLGLFSLVHLSLIVAEDGFMVEQAPEHTFMPLIVGGDFGPA